MSGRIRREFIRSFLLVLLVGSAQYILGQNYRFTYYTGNDGLSTDLIKSVAITPGGFITLATDDGFILYNGRTFTTYQDGLYSRFAKFVLTTSKGRMLISDDMGLTEVKIKGVTPTFKKIKSGQVERNDSTLWYPKMMYEDSRGNIWVTDNQNVYILKEEELIPLPLNLKITTENVQRSFAMADDGLGNLFAFYDRGNSYLIDTKNITIRETTGMLPDKSFFYAMNNNPGEIMVAGTSGLWLLKSSQNPLTPEKRLIIPGIEFSCLIKYHDNTYIGSTWNNGLYEIIEHDGKYSYKQIEYYNYTNANYMVADGNENIWIASDNGLVLLSTKMFERALPNLVKGYVQHIQPYKEGVITTEGKKIIYTWHKEDEFYSESLYDHHSESELIRLLPDSNGIWMSDNQGNIGFLSQDRKVKWYSSGRKGAIFILAPGLPGEIWYCQDGQMGIGLLDQSGAYRYFGREVGITSRIINISASPDKKYLYLGGSSDKGFLFRFELARRTAYNISLPVDFRHNIPMAVNDISFQNGNIWLATSFGLLKYDGGKYSRINTGTITSSAIKGVTFDEDKNLWFTSSIGIVKYKAGIIYTFSEHNGLPSKTSSFRSIVTDKYNHLWSGTINGIAFSKNSSDVKKVPRPIVILCEIDGKVMEWDHDEVVEFDTYSFLQFVVASPAFPGHLVTYQYRIISESDTTGWENTNQSMEFHLNTWKRGSYTIQIRAGRAGNFAMSDPLELNLKVKSLWYQTPWIITLMLASLIGIIWTILILNRNYYRAYRRKLEGEISIRTSEIRAQKDFIENQRNSILTQNKELEKKNVELSEARHKAEEYAKSRTMFLSTMSHELRTPLNAVIGMTYILLSEEPRPNQIDNLQTLRFSAENLLALINDILDFSKIEAGKLSFEEVDFDLFEKIVSIAQVLRVKADEKGITIEEKIGKDVPQFLVGDSTRLNQILFNLAGNAIKFTPKGGVLITVDKTDETDTHYTIRFTVSDSGIGIAPEKIDSIFDSFTQAENDITRKYGGTGLGLAITKKLIDLQGGTIRVKSSLGKGTTFTVEMSYRKSEKTLKTDEPIILTEFKTFNGEKVLVVDDNQINLIVARKFLSKWNLQVDTAENGAEAYELARSLDYEMILMDIQMPEMDGYTASRAIRQYEAQVGRRPIPIIALTASALLDVREKIYASGMNDFVTKPFNPKELNYKIGKILISLRNNSED